MVGRRVKAECLEHIPGRIGGRGANDQDQDWLVLGSTDLHFQFGCFHSSSTYVILKPPYLKPT